MSHLQCVGLNQLRDTMTDYNSSMESGSSGEEGSSTVHPMHNACDPSMWDGPWTQASSANEVITSNSMSELAGNSPFTLSQADILTNYWLSGFHPMSHAGSNLCVDQSRQDPNHTDQPGNFIPDALSAIEMSSSPSVDRDSSSHISAHFSGLYERNSALKHQVTGPGFAVTTQSYEGVETYGKSADGGSHFAYGKTSASNTALQLLQSLDQESPSSPLAPNSSMLQQFSGHWDATHPLLTWANCEATSQASGTTLQLMQGANQFCTDVQQLPAKRELFPSTVVDTYYDNYNDSRSNGEISSQMIDQLETLMQRNVVPSTNTEFLIGSRGTYSATAGPWSHISEVGSPIRGPLKLMPTLMHDGRDATNFSPNNVTSVGSNSCLSRDDQTPSVVTGAISSIFTSSAREEAPAAGDQNGKHRFDLLQVEDENTPPLKRQSLDTAALSWQRTPALRRVESKTFPSTCMASQAMDLMVAVGPALNTNGKPRARRGSATDPQSVYAQQRRGRINERLKILCNLVPNGAKVDIVTMLEEAYHYVKFLQLQVKLLSSDEHWIYATPNSYNGMEMSVGMHTGTESTSPIIM